MTAILFAYLLVGLVLAALCVFDVFGEPDELETPTPGHRLIVFFLAPWLLLLQLIQGILTDDDDEPSFGEYFFTLFAFVWFGEEDRYDAD